jgi:sugar lactone lactonase YvrE
MDLMAGPTATCVWPVAAQLGEGPLWCDRTERLYFVDLKGRTLHAVDADGARRRSWAMPDYVCWLLPRRDGDGFMVGLRDTIARLWLEPALRIEPLCKPLGAVALARLNDAKVDHHGRLWAGSMHDEDYSDPVGALFRFDPDGTLSRLTHGEHICNGPAFSVDGLTVYHTDSYLARVYAYALGADGSLGARRLFRQFDAASEGSPDGMCVDSEDCLWIAQWGGSRVCRYGPDGTLLATVALPVSQAASCAFGGKHLRTLYVTSARESLDATQLAREPLAGALFAVELDVAGLPARRYG